MKQQLDLFQVIEAYRSLGESATNQELYQRVAEIAGIPDDALNKTQPVGKDGAKRSLVKRKIRWYQQTLKDMGLLKREKRGVWSLHDVESDQHKGLDLIRPGQFLLAYSTKHGFAVWGDAASFFQSYQGEPIQLTLTSPPYPLRTQRDYSASGYEGVNAWIDFIVATLEPIIKNMRASGSIALNIGNDIFESRSPALSIYQEKLVITLFEKLGLHKMQHIPWVNTSKPPGPTQWACLPVEDGKPGRRTQLCTGWESIYVFSPDPHAWGADNRRVLKPHTDKHKKFLEEGNKRHKIYGDGAYRLRGEKSFGNKTAGTIPKNVLTAGHACSDTKIAHRIADENGLPRHGAQFPSTVPGFLMDWLCPSGSLVVDMFSGTNKTGLNAERRGLKWIAVDRVLQYLQLQRSIFAYHAQNSSTGEDSFEGMASYL